MTIRERSVSSLVFDNVRSEDTLVLMSPKDEKSHRVASESTGQGGFAASGDADRSVRAPFVVNCHHNYIAIEEHFGDKVYVTRKGAINAEEGRYGIIPGSMGAKSFIIKGLGNPQSFNSCSHGAGRKMSRTKAKSKFSIDDLKKQTAGVECRKDRGVVDEIPGAYKDIEEVMRAQSDLVEIVAELKQVICVKG